MHSVRRVTLFGLLASLSIAPAALAQNASTAGPLLPDQPIRGWTLLSDSEKDDLAVIAAAREYDINHLQLSHEIVMDLRDVKEEKVRGLVNRLTDAAHAAGIREVVAWDHALYELKYYPERFRSGPGGTIDLDNPEFWAWFKQDYRDMLDRVPHVNGLVLTFIETGARAENQYSRRLTTPEEKLAAVVNAVADVVIGERHLNLYARTFAYTQTEYDNITRAVERFDRPGIRLMMKETPHDFFLTHPNDFYAGKLPNLTLVEFDAAGEFNGQGLIASTWPEYILRRWSDLSKRPHVAGYVARTDRYGATRLIGRPSEINLYALKRYTEDPTLTADAIYDEFITRRYGSAALPHVKKAFQNAYDIVTSTLYTLGTNMASHSSLDYDPYSSSYARHVSGKWIDPPVAHVAHGVNRDLDYWTDVVDHLAPPAIKAPKGAQWDEVPWVRERGLIHPDERMNETFLRYVVTEKAFGVAKAAESLREIELARSALKPTDYTDLHAYFERTLLTTRLYRAVAAAYFGYRIYARGDGFRSEYVMTTTRDGLRAIPDLARAIREYPVKPAAGGQWSWVEDADQAMEYYDRITHTGWPASTRGAANPYGGVVFPLN
jgi:hypothetical protein